jgi:hypothetical protein
LGVEVRLAEWKMEAVRPLLLLLKAALFLNLLLC